MLPVDKNSSAVDDINNFSSYKSCGILSHVPNYSLGLSINHLNGDGLDSWNPWCDLTCKHSCPVVNRSVSDKQSLRHLGNLSVKGRHNIRQCFNEGDFRTKCSVNVRKFETNVSRADDGDPFRDGLKFECTVRSINRFFVNSDSRWYEWDRARGKDDVLLNC